MNLNCKALWTRLDNLKWRLKQICTICFHVSVRNNHCQLQIHLRLFPDCNFHACSTPWPKHQWVNCLIKCYWTYSIISSTKQLAFSQHSGPGWYDKHQPVFQCNAHLNQLKGLQQVHNKCNNPVTTKFSWNMLLAISVENTITNYLQWQYHLLFFKCYNSFPFRIYGVI